jgi:hypothetical protein
LPGSLLPAPGLVFGLVDMAVISDGTCGPWIQRLAS